MAGVALARPADLLLGILDHLVPLRHPAHRARQGEDGGEHRGRDAHRLEDDARIEVDVREQLALGEVLVVERDPLQLLGDRQLRVVLLAEQLQHLVGALLEHAGARVVVLVDAMAEAHQPRMAVLVLRLLDELGDAVDAADLGQHLDHGLVGAAMRRPPQRGDAGGDRRIGAGAGRADQAHGRGRGVLLVVGVQDEDPVERLGQGRVDLVGLARHREHHVQEVLGVAQVVARIDERLADRIFVAHRGDGRDLGDQPVSLRSCR